MGDKIGLFGKREDRANEVNLEELEKEGNNRIESIDKIHTIIVGIIGVAWTVFQIYTGFFGLLPAVLQRATTLGFALVLTFFGYSAKRKGGKKDSIPFYDWILATLSVTVVVYGATLHPGAEKFFQEKGILK